MIRYQLPKILAFKFYADKGIISQPEPLGSNS